MSAVISLIMWLSLFAINIILIGFCLAGVFLCILHSIPGILDEIRVMTNIDEDEFEISSILKHLHKKQQVFLAVFAFGTASCVFAFQTHNFRYVALCMPGLIVLGALIIILSQSKIKM